MALNTRSPIAPYWYVLESQYENDLESGERKPREDAAQFLVQGLNGFQMSDVQSEGFVDTAGNMRFTRAGILKALNYGLNDWRNINHDGQPAKFQKNMAKNMELLDIGTMNEIVGAILTASDLTEEEEKN